ncbi:MAG: LysR family transcriptional regulator [Desulfobacterota bacterium]|nr:LysR family transcriptional regulator [Thermodesulfobacteriota bacterium]
MNINQLKIFYVSGKQQSFSAAAEELFLTQPAVTMQVRQLEDYFQVALFHRHGKKIELTEAGRLLHRYARRIFDLTAAAERAVWELKELETGTLKVGTTKTYAKHLMPALISSFQEQHPGMRVILDEGSSAEIAHSLLVRKNELALIAKASYPQPLKVLSFAQEELVLIMGRFHPLARSRIDFIKELVETGKGISFVVRSAVEEELQRGALKTRPLAEGPFYLNVDIVYLKNRTLSPAAQAFLEILMRTMAIKEKELF